MTARILSTVTGNVAAADIRVETWLGREYTVVPVVGIVEGVLQGANAANPEFAPASEFGKFPMSWDGRPVVLNHPQVQGHYVSANSLPVMESYSFGFLANTQLDGDKLKFEAWIDNARVAELGGEFQETLDRVNARDLIEVSVGAFLDTVQKGGTFKGKKYMSVWANVVPDHLAFLSAGVLGACSIADGCGAPRLNQGQMPISVQSAIVIGGSAGGTACCDSCANGASHMPNANATSPTSTPTNTPAVLSDAEASALQTERRAEVFGQLGINSVDPAVTLEDARSIISVGLCEYLDVPYYDIEVMVLTVDVVVYYVWGSGRGNFNQLSYSVAADGTVTFSGDPVPVNLLTRILPKTEVAEAPSGISNNNERTENMPGETGTEASASTVGADSTAAATETPAAVSAPVVNKVGTFAELLASAPPEVRAQHEYSARIFKDHKDGLITGILAVEGCAFDKTDLDGMEINVLERLAKTTGVQSFAGRAVPGDTLGVNSSTDSNAKPAFAVAAQGFLGKKQGE